MIVLSNTRPVYPVGVITGELSYPSLMKIRTSLEELSAQVRLIDATDMPSAGETPFLRTSS